MHLQSHINFVSNAYQDFHWKNIFCVAGSSVSTNENPIGLVNHRHLMMIPDNYFEYDHIQICFPEKTGEWIGSNIFYRSLPNTLVAGLAFLEIDKKNCPEEMWYENDLYIRFLQEIAFRLNSVCNTIFKYTYEHLSYRYYDDMIISKIPIIQSDFAEVYVLCEKLALMAKNVFSINDAIYFMSIAIEVLLLLSKLSGARSILQNRSIELMYHLKLFQKFIGDSDDKVAGV